VHTAPGFNGNNYGAGLECDTQDGYVLQAGEYYNSFRRPSFYVGGGKLWGDHWQAGLFAGVATGYETRPVAPIGGFLGGYTMDKVRVQIMLVPPVGEHVGLVHLTLGIRY